MATVWSSYVRWSPAGWRRILTARAVLLAALAAAAIVVAFALSGEVTLRRVVALHPDGRLQVVSPPCASFNFACVHPDGTHAVYSGGASGPPRIWRTDLATDEAVPLTPAEFGAIHPSYSWDGRWIVFAADRDTTGQRLDLRDQSRGGMYPADTNLYLMDADGGSVRRLTRGAYQDVRPSFRADGKRIVFVSDRGGGNDLWTIDVDGAGRPEPLGLRRAGWRGGRPWYSVDGRWIYFHGHPPGKRWLLTSRLPAEGGTPELMPNAGKGESHGTFADPGGEVLLIHHAPKGGSWGIWELPLDGSPLRQVQIPGVVKPIHATRSRNEILVFDHASPAFWRVVWNRLSRPFGECD